MLHVAQILVPALTAQFPAARVGVRTPADFTTTGNLPFIKVTGVGGGQTLTLGRLTADVETIVGNSPEAPGDLAAMELSGQVHDWLVWHCSGVIGAGVVSRVRVQSMPSVRPVINDNVTRYGGVYVVNCHDLVPAL